MTLYINAMNVHQGGGRALLLALFAEITPDSGVVALVDARIDIDPALARRVGIRRVKPKVSARLFAEYWLSRTVKAGDHLLGFGNLPPLFQSQGSVAVFIQNRYLIDGEADSKFSLPLRTLLRHAAERWWLRNMIRNADIIIVQTPSMHRLVTAMGLVGTRLSLVCPFLAQPLVSSNKQSMVQADAMVQDEVTEFLYVASGEPHKNHRQLVKAWALLADSGLYPRLDLTIGDEATELVRWIVRMTAQYGLAIVNHGRCDLDSVRVLYEAADALIFPSVIESFGLPLLEAAAMGLPILAAEMDYVRDVVSPVETFDPMSASSIARAVRRFLRMAEPVLTPVGAAVFLAEATPIRA